MLTLLFPACGCQVGQFPVFLRQLEFAVAKAGSSGEALLGQAPIGRQQRLPVHLEFLKLKEMTQSQETSPSDRGNCAEANGLTSAVVYTNTV